MITKESISVGSLDWFYRKVQAEQETDKAPVVLLHGIPSQSYSWRWLMPALAEQGRDAIAPDWIGHGFSAKPDKRDFAYTPDAYIQALSDLLDALEIQTCSLAVQGFLGSVGLQFALRHSDRLERLIIFNTPLSPSAKLPWKMQQWGIPLVGDMLTQDPLLIDRTLEGGSGFQIADDDLDIYRRPFLQTSSTGRSLVATIKNLQLPQATAEIADGLKTWRKPTQIIWGMLDPWLDSAMVEPFASQSNVEWVKLPEAKHYPQEHWGEEIEPDLVTFLRRQFV
ncbi:alpha/beta fold hydrolase [Spirulina subsalsa FACHB-351]|uniref:Alpha/beta fold hydrolase n=1 Tax=Spirulina subsalsa FACHB-351 TaxID=234711 RepID=A0ABT3L2K0_9CYAN|nr:alpha/beta fold hydrolase [Spirulina subsalsa]MCW6035735.1 alpha/beta fold hydrolase [Spirulina subsalsa FACHB-351]